MNYKMKRRICSIVAVVVVFITTLVLPTVAASGYPDIGLSGGLPYSMGVPAPVPVQFTFNYIDQSDINVPLQGYYSLAPSSPVFPALDSYPQSADSSVLIDSSAFSVSTDFTYSDRSEINVVPSAEMVDGSYVYSVDGMAVYNYSFDVVSNAPSDYVMTYGDGDPDLYVSAKDFYSWSEDTFLNYDYNWESEFYLEIPIHDSSTLVNGFEFHSAQIVWSTAGSSEIHVANILPSDSGTSDLRRGRIWADCDLWSDSNIPDQVYYIHSFEVAFNYVVYDSLDLGDLFSSSGRLVYNYCSDLREFDVDSGVPVFDPEGNPSVPLMSYVTWLGTAASGFLELELFPGFRLGGLLMTVIAFAFVMWFLKVFAGG